jgi:exodeoxyribonuclease V beta subunit
MTDDLHVGTTSVADPFADVAVESFSLAAPLPTGRVVLRASAGTGKTYTIAGLAARYVAEGVCELPQLLVVTFTRAAAAELRDRVRTRLVATRAHLDAVLAGAPAGSDDAAIDVLAQVDRAELERRSRRLASALADFDAATITTIHGFCQQVLSGLGLVADLDPAAQLTEDPSGLLEEVVDDVLVGRFVASEDPPVTRRQLLELAATVVGNPGARLVPDPSTVDGQARLRAELVVEVRDRFAARKHQQQVLSYDDLLTRLRDALSDHDRGDAAVATLRRRYRIALIDEFQDTDPVQWDILGRAFSGPDATLVLIGDPKQAIYAFRGADVHAYLDAVASTAQHATLATSWRSDADLLTAFDTMFSGITFGHPHIAHHPVTAAPGHEAPRLLVPGGVAPLRIRCLRRDQGLRGSQGDIPSPVARNHIVADVTAETVRLLNAGAVVVDRDREGAETRRRDLSCGDIAVLVRTNAEANQVQRALLDADVPAIINGVGSVFTTGAAADWRRLLEALEQPTSVGRVRAVALSSFIGWSAERLAGIADDELVPLHDELHTWVELLRDHGVASLLRTITVSQALPERVLARPDGERFLTDLHHLGELLHTAASSEQLGPTALAGWLRARMAEARAEAVPPDERARRLESDDEAVQILTIHRSKGLEFPVVFAPFLSSPGRAWDPVPVFHDDGQRTIDVGGRCWDGFDDDQERSLTEQQGEALRLLYVALTRARHHVVVWWAPVRKAGVSALGRVLFGRRDLDGVVDTSGTAPIGNDDRLAERLEELAAPAEGRIAIEVTPADHAPARWQPVAASAAELAAARLDRDIDRGWRRTSYSRLTDHTYQPATVASDPDEAVTDDEQLGPAALLGSAATAAPTFTEAVLRDLALPLADAGGRSGVRHVRARDHGGGRPRRRRPGHRAAPRHRRGPSPPRRRRRPGRARPRPRPGHRDAARARRRGTPPARHRPRRPARRDGVRATDRRRRRRRPIRIHPCPLQRRLRACSPP